MPMVINSNIMSLKAQRNLTTSQASQNQAMERLTSGKRINSAKDDAAGLAISSGLTSQVRGLNQAVRNANDGISLVQTAEGALQESSNILQRMRELSVQSANGTYDSGNRDTLNAEVTQLKAELTRIAETTTFNGQKVLDGSLGTFGLQVGSEANETINVSFGKQSFKAEDLGGVRGDVVGRASSDTDLATSGLGVTGDVTINHQVVDADDLNAATNLKETLAVFNESVEGVETSAFAELKATATGDGIIEGTNSVTLTVKNDEGDDVNFSISDTNSLDELRDKINEVSGGAITAKIETNADGEKRLAISAKNAESITVAGAGASEALGIDPGTAQFSLVMNDTNPDNGDAIDIEYATASDAGVLGLDARKDKAVTGQAPASSAGVTDADDIVINGVKIDATDGSQDDLVEKINAKFDQTGVYASTDGTALTLSGDGEISLEMSDEGEAATGLLSTNSAAYAGDTVNDIDISTVEGAQEAIKTLDAALETVNNSRGEMGAVNNRLDFTINNLTNVSENAAASRSRIEDADFAAETAALSRAQVLQQAGTAMLSQANSAPQQVLSLLQ